MKKSAVLIFSLLLAFSLFSACGSRPEKEPSDPPSAYFEYTAEEMVSEVYENTGVDVSEVISDYDVDKMTSEEKEELLIYLMNYAHYKDLSSEAFAADFKSVLSDKTFSALCAALSDLNFDSLSPDEKIKAGQTFYEEYYFYEYSEADALAAVSAYYGTDESGAKNILEEKGYFESDDKKAKSKIIYEIIVLSEF